MQLTPQLLKEFRAHFGFTQRSLAYKLGVWRNTVNRWEMGVNPIPRWLASVLFLDRTVKRVKRPKRRCPKKGGRDVSV